MTKRTRLSHALLASATVHAAILLLLAPGAPPAVPGIPGDAFRVTLIAPHKFASGLRATRPRAGSQSEDSVNPRDDASNDRHAAAPAPSPPTASSGALLDSLARDQDAATIIGRTVQAMLHEAFVAHFHYPPLARQNGWQGEVRLGLRIEPNGELARIRVITSSGYGILDNAAVSSLKTVGRLPDAATLLKGSGFNLILPVHYQLIDS